MHTTYPVDAAMNIFGKPCQTALSILSLLRHSGQHIGTLYALLETHRPKYDDTPMDFLQLIDDKVQVIMPQHWLKIDALEPDRMEDRSYRHSIRYQYAWETTDKDYLFIMHNDVIFRGDIISNMVEHIGDHIILGDIGQCWNCPASRDTMVASCRVNGGNPCNNSTYTDFQLTFAQLNILYKASQAKGDHIREFLPIWSEEIKEQPWPLPECRVNEWACLVNMTKARPATVPDGAARPFGAFVSAGCHNMDTSVAWFRDVHKQGHRAKHFDIYSYVHHTGGTPALFDQAIYEKDEAHARNFLRREYPDFVEKTRKHGIQVF